MSDSLPPVFPPTPTSPTPWGRRWKVVGKVADDKDYRVTGSWMQSTHSLPWLGWGRGVDGEVVSWGRGECLVSYTYLPHPYVLHLITSQPPVAAVSRCRQTHAPNESRDIAEIRGRGRRWRRRWQTFVQLRGTAEKQRCHGAPPVVCNPSPSRPALSPARTPCHTFHTGSASKFCGDNWN